jgi:predicted DsbA family dithiol-disulfide isomerase
VNVEIWSDVACPWCYVGKRRFEQALSTFEHRDEVHVAWRSFELDPSAPRERAVDAATHLAEKYGTSREQAVAMHERMAGVGAGEGLHSEGEPIGDPATLERLAIEVGLPADEVREVLAGERYGAEVRDDERAATSFGISGVPFFVVDRSLAASGAQSPEILGELLRRGWSARPTAAAVADATGPAPPGA